MTLASSPLVDLAKGGCKLLAALDAAAAAPIGFAWSDTADYADDQVGFWLGALPIEVSRGVSVMTVPLSHHPSLNQSLTNLQFISRSASDDVSDVMQLDDAICTYLLGLYPVTLPNGVQVSTLAWNHGGWLGQDDSNRQLWSSNFNVSHFRPSPHRN